MLVYRHEAGLLLFIAKPYYTMFVVVIKILILQRMINDNELLALGHPGLPRVQWHKLRWLNPTVTAMDSR